jgi:hypothetical protein
VTVSWTRPRARATVAVALLLTLAPLATSPASAAKARTTRPPTLAGNTTLRGDHTAHMRVRLSRTATLKFDSSMSVSPAVRTVGRGRFVGVMLARVGTTATSGQWFAQVRVTGCGTKNCQPGAPGNRDLIDGQAIGDFTGFPEVANTTSFDHLTFPAGDYELSLIADAAPVAVTITLQGLGGATTLFPRAAQYATTDSVDPTFLPTPQAATEMSAGGHASIPTSLGVLAYAVSYRFAVLTAELTNWCLYSGTQSPPVGAFLPGCPVGAEGVVTPPGFIIVQQAVNHPAGEYGIVFVLGRQTWSQGMWSAGANVIQSSNPASFLWLGVN